LFGRDVDADAGGGVAPLAVMLGGLDRRTLFILTAKWYTADHYTNAQGPSRAAGTRRLDG
jgi:hypothetical protein